MKHIRFALWDVTSGTAEEAIEIARSGFRPLLESEPGFVRYEVGTLDNGVIVSLSVWESANQAKHAVAAAHDWVTANLADRIKLREEHLGELSWDDGPA